MAQEAPEPESRRRGESGRLSPVDANPEPAPVTETEEVAGRGAASVIEFEPRPAAAGRGLAALRHPNFRIFWLSQMVSLIGTWMQTVAQSWLVLVLSGSPLTLGVVSALQFLPILLFSMLGGVIADRMPKRKLLLATQSSAMMLAFALGGLVATGRVQVVYVFAMAVLLGLVNAVDMPTRQAFVVELVGPRDLRNAIALNSAAFNSARLVGPAVAGLAIGWVGIAGCFFINGISFAAVLAALLAIDAGNRATPRDVEPESVWADLREGLAYVANSPALRLVVVLIAAVGTFGMNLSVLIPVLAQDVLHVGAQGYGYLSSAMGFGSLLAAILLASLGTRPQRYLVLGSAAILGALQMVMPLVTEFLVAVPILAGLGFFMIFLTTLSNTVLQTSTPNALRGRVMSVYAMVFAGTTPFGSLFAGAISETWGVGAAFFAGGLISVAATLAVYVLSLGPRDGRHNDREGT